MEESSDKAKFEPVISFKKMVISNFVSYIMCDLMDTRKFLTDPKHLNGSILDFM